MSTRETTFTPATLDASRRRVSSLVSAMVVFSGVFFGGVAVATELPASFAWVCFVSCGLAVGAFALARRGHRLAADRLTVAIAVTWTGLVALATPNYGTLAFFLPVMLHLAFVEEDRRWFAGQLAVLVVGFLVGLQRAGAAEYVDVDAYLSQDRLVLLHCIGAGFLSALVAGFHRDFGLRLHLTSKAYAARLGEEVAQTAATNAAIDGELVRLGEAHEATARAIAEERAAQRDVATVELRLAAFATSARERYRPGIAAARETLAAVVGPPTARASRPDTHRSGAPEVADEELRRDAGFLGGALETADGLLAKLIAFHGTAELTTAPEAVALAPAFTAALERERARAVERAAADPAAAGASVVQVRGCTSDIDAAAAAAVAHAHPAYVALVFGELIRNALVFHDGTRAPHVALLGERRGGRVYVTVRDNGIGVPAAYRDRVLGMFTRLHARGVYPGHGLGLPLVRRVCGLSGGTVAVAAAPAGGTDVTFDLPLALAQ